MQQDSNGNWILNEIEQMDSDMAADEMDRIGDIARDFHDLMQRVGKFCKGPNFRDGYMQMEEAMIDMLYVQYTRFQEQCGSAQEYPKSHFMLEWEHECRKPLKERKMYQDVLKQVAEQNKGATTGERLLACLNTDTFAKLM